MQTVLYSAQDEVKFYVGDAASKLLLVPVRGNAEAEKAASELGVPVGVVSVSWSDGAPLAWVCNQVQDSEQKVTSSEATKGI